MRRGVGLNLMRYNFVLNKREFIVSNYGSPSLRRAPLGELGALSVLAVKKVFDFEVYISLVIVTTPQVLKASI